MSRNNDRLAAPEFEENKTEPHVFVEPPKVDVFSYMPPTEIVDLPSRGKFYPQGHPLYNKDCVEIRYMTAKEEDILTNRSLIKKGMALDRLISSVLVDKTIDVQTLLTGDKTAILIQIRITGFGAGYETKAQCRSCGNTSENTFNLDECKPVFGGDPQGYDIVAQDEKTGNFSIRLPKTGWIVECRPFTGYDETYLFQTNESRKKHQLEETPLIDFLKRVVVAINGQDARDVVNKFVEIVPTLDSRYLRNAYAKMIPTLDTTFIFECPNCSVVNQVDMPMTTDFFWPTTK